MKRKNKISGPPKKDRFSPKEEEKLRLKMLADEFKMKGENNV